MPDEEQTPVRPRPVAAAPAAPPEDALSLDDHRTYSQQLYGRPAWVLEGVFSHAGLNPADKHTPSVVKKALEEMLGQADKRYEGKQ